jgi:hypothetical protein
MNDIDKARVVRMAAIARFSKLVVKYLYHTDWTLAADACGVIGILDRLEHERVRRAQYFGDDDYSIAVSNFLKEVFDIDDEIGLLLVHTVIQQRSQGDEELTPQAKAELEHILQMLGGHNSNVSSILQEFQQPAIENTTDDRASGKEPYLDVTPTTGPLGTYFTVTGNGFIPDEDVTVWYITPSGFEARFPPTYTPNSRGFFSFVPYSSSTPTLMEIGTWELYGKGSTSGATGRIKFEVEPALRLSRPLRVFLCHSSDDKEPVRQLYNRLKMESVDPWLDEEKILPGQDWSLEIKRAVRESEIILACLSETSITKEGYVQKEIKLALDIADEKPEGSIFLIPVRLEECDIPSRLQHLHRLDLFEDKGFERLIYSLRARAEELGITLRLDD